MPWLLTTKPLGTIDLVNGIYRRIIRISVFLFIGVAMVGFCFNAQVINIGYMIAVDVSDFNSKSRTGIKFIAVFVRSMI